MESFFSIHQNFRNSEAAQVFYFWAKYSVLFYCKMTLFLCLTNVTFLNGKVVSRGKSVSHSVKIFFPCVFGTMFGVDNTVCYTDNCSNLCVISYGEEEVTRLQKTSNDEDEKNMQDSFCSSLFFNCSFFLLWTEKEEEGGSWPQFKSYKVHLARKVRTANLKTQIQFWIKLD